ncbi:MAG: threonine/serine exporter family protein [Lactobacillus sp.]|nr:threonine/serine exporter family protein [Lactobacillus sp.]
MDYSSKILETCLLAGRLMIEAGSEMYRVEDTMLRIANNAHADDPRVFATPTAVFMSLDGGKLSKLVQIQDRGINLELVDRVNTLSRKFAQSEITVDQLYDAIKEVYKTPSYPMKWQLVGAGVLSATLMVMFTNSYDWLSLPIAGIVGVIGYWAYMMIQRITNLRFISELVSASLMTLLTYGFQHIFPAISIDHVLIGALMTLVPGVPLTNALRDMFLGDLLSGVVRLMEASLTAMSLCAGVVIIMRFLGA